MLHAQCFQFIAQHPPSSWYALKQVKTPLSDPQEPLHLPPLCTNSVGCRHYGVLNISFAADGKRCGGYNRNTILGLSQSEITELLIGINMMESRVYVVYVSPDSGLEIFAMAKKLGMMTTGYVWISQNGSFSSTYKSRKEKQDPIEAARTMLADSLLPIPFWAEAVNTACYVLNRVLVTKPQNKTPYELLIGTGPNWMFDLDFLTNTMNYIPVSVENQVNVDAGTQDSYVAGL
ncbi:putative ribonuclease H-like domain-containing protein [Tanacetum coccineum]